MRGLILALALAVGWSMRPPAVMAMELVIVESTAAELKEGQIIDGSKPLRLSAGSRVTAITEAGEVIALRGPYWGIPAPGDTEERVEVTAALSRLVEWGTTQSEQIATTRGAPRNDAPDLWAVDANRSATHCLPGGTAPRLWRHDATRSITLRMKRLPAAAEVSVEWPDGADFVGWPAELGVEDGGAYMILEQFRARPITRVTLRTLPPGLPTDAHRAARMADHGCRRQATALLAMLRRSGHRRGSTIGTD